MEGGGEGKQRDGGAQTEITVLRTSSPPPPPPFCVCFFFVFFVFVFCFFLERVGEGGHTERDYCVEDFLSFSRGEGGGGEEAER